MIRIHIFTECRCTVFIKELLMQDCFSTKQNLFMSLEQIHNPYTSSTVLQPHTFLGRGLG